MGGYYNGESNGKRTWNRGNWDYVVIEIMNMIIVRILAIETVTTSVIVTAIVIAIAIKVTVVVAIMVIVIKIMLAIMASSTKQ